ncbi:Copper transport protein YcnJ [bacterium HR32]|nr:Copper transport protein YcnJ [bacterium HR32]
MYHLSVFLHILAAVVWVGGMLFLALVAIPVLRTLPDRPRAELVAQLGERFRPVAWTCIVLLVVTGILNLAFRGVTWESVATGRLWQSPFGQVLAWKLGFVLVLLLLSALHDFSLGPRSTRLARSSDPDGQLALTLRRRAAWIGRLSALLALVVLALAVMLVRGLPH